MFSICPSAPPPPITTVEIQFVGEDILKETIFTFQINKTAKGPAAHGINDSTLMSSSVTLSPVPPLPPITPHGPLPFWSPTSWKSSASYKQSISKAKCATCFWQLGALANVDKWTEPPEGFYESAAAWQIYLLAATESCTGKHRLRYTARLALPVLLPYSLGVHTHAATERSLTCNSSVLWIVNLACVFYGTFLHFISNALEQIVLCPWEAENVFV